MVQIDIGNAERASRALGSDKLMEAVRAIREDGFVVLRDAADPQAIASLRDKMLGDIDAYLNRPNRPFNWNSGNLQQDPPPMPPFLYRDVVANDFAIQVGKEILGAGMWNGFYSGNTALQSESRQPVHADTGHLWPNQTHVHPPVQLVVNFPLVDMGPENGATEIWPGTHHDPSVVLTDGDLEVSEPKLAEWRAKSPPLQPRVNAGSVLIRDIRLWHAGMPNRTPNPRPMVALIFTVGWWPRGGRIAIQKGAESLFEHPDLTWHAEFVDGPIDYIHQTGGYKFEEQESE